MLEDYYKLKISLKKLRKLIDVDKIYWTNMNSTNCYAYALGLDIPYYKIIDFAYDPGVLSNSDIFLPDYDFFTYEMLLNNIFSDFEALGIDVREVNSSEQIDDDEWKIALFTSGDGKYLKDFHFLRQHKAGLWFHKNGFQGRVSPYDINGDVITNPEECFFKTRKYDKSFALKLK